MNERLGLTEPELTMLSAELYELVEKFKAIQKKYNLSMTLRADQYGVLANIHETVKADDVDTTLTEIRYRENAITINEPIYFDSNNNLIKKGEE